MKAISATHPLFSLPTNHALLSQAVRVYLANLRQATAKTKTRSEINRTKKKWFRQKGTGNARHGARTPGIFVGGGVVHGPRGQQNYALTLNAKMKSKAILTALALQKSNTFICDELSQVDGKTKSAVKILAEKLKAGSRLLLVVDTKTPLLVRSFNNLNTVFLTTAQNLSLMTVMRAHTIIVTSKALEVLHHRLLPSPTPAKETKEVAAPVRKKTPVSSRKTTTAKKTVVAKTATAKKPLVKKLVKSTK